MFFLLCLIWSNLSMKGQLDLYFLSFLHASLSSFPLLSHSLSPFPLSLSQDPEDRLRAFKGLIQHWLHQTQRILKDIVPLFNE